jgi:hypothetical protein
MQYLQVFFPFCCVIDVSFVIDENEYEFWREIMQLLPAKAMIFCFDVRPSDIFEPSDRTRYHFRKSSIFLSMFFFANYTYSKIINDRKEQLVVLTNGKEETRTATQTIPITSISRERGAHIAGDHSCCYG